MTSPYLSFRNQRRRRHSLGRSCSGPDACSFCSAVGAAPSASLGPRPGRQCRCHAAQQECGQPSTTKPPVAPCPPGRPRDALEPSRNNVHGKKGAIFPPGLLLERGNLSYQGPPPAPSSLEGQMASCLLQNQSQAGRGRHASPDPWEVRLSLGSGRVLSSFIMRGGGVTGAGVRFC